MVRRAGREATTQHITFMAIESNASFIPTLNEFLAHHGQSNEAYAPKSVVVRLPDNSTVTLAQFTALRDSLQAQQNLARA